MYVILWRFRPRPGREVAFEQAYGPSGPWVQLFSRARGYRGSELLRSTAPAGEYLCVDRWASAHAWDGFREEWGSEYRELDRAMGDLTALETPMGSYTTVEGTAL